MRRPLVGLLVVSFGWAWLGPSTAAATPSTISVSRDHAKQLGLALRQCHEVRRRFPPAHSMRGDHPPVSWRIHVLAYADLRYLYDRYDVDEPWDGPENSTLADCRPPVYWSDFGRGKRYTREGTLLDAEGRPLLKDCETAFVAVTGPETAWFDPKGTRLRDVTDGPEDTIVLLEVPNSGIHWMEPRDFTWEDVAARMKPGAEPSLFTRRVVEQTFLTRKEISGTHAVLADGGVIFLPANITPEQLRALITANGGEEIDLRDLLESVPVEYEVKYDLDFALGMTVVLGTVALVTMTIWLVERRRKRRCAA